MQHSTLVGKTIVISGGSSGIGLELVKRLQAENQLIVIGRDKKKLAELEARGVTTFSMDISIREERAAFFRWMDEHYPSFNVLINNAGWSRSHKLVERMSRALELDDLDDYELELKHNLEAHIGMSLEALPRLLRQPGSMIINVTTGLVYNPKAANPYYCAAKAGLHSFTQSLREQTKHHDLKVIEVLPPLVDTPFHANGLPETVKAMTPQNVAKETLQQLGRGQEEIRIGLSKVAYLLARLKPTLGFLVVNRS